MTDNGSMDRDLPERRTDAEQQYNDHLERSKRQWNRWSDWYRLSEQDFAPIREDAVAALSLEPGDRVLDIGCGPGVNFELLVSRVGSDGHVVGLDYSPDMVTKARTRVAENGWDNVQVMRADATTADLGGPYDAAVATLSLSVMPDIRAAVENIHDAIAPGGQLAIVDIRPFPGGPARLLNPFVRRFLRWYANWNPDENVVDTVSRVFPETALLDTYFGGTSYAMRATRE